MSIEGKTVVITGAASGIGRALALGFHKDGAQVLGADIDRDGLASLAADGVATRVVDVRRKAEVSAMIDQAVQTTGRVDVLFNNAGNGGGELIERMEEGYFETFFAIHVFGGLYGLQAALPVMRKQNYGRIINTLSRNAEIDMKGMSAYGSAKAALWHLTRTAAREVADADILVNGMIPGFTATGMTRGIEGLQQPEVVYPHALFMATLPAGGPTGRVFWNSEEYRLFDPHNEVNRRPPRQQQ